MSTPDREHCRHDVREALDAIGPWWCDSQLLFDGAPEPVRRDREQEAKATRQAPLTLWDESE
jgi:hypothetical protein